MVLAQDFLGLDDEIVEAGFVTDEAVVVFGLPVAQVPGETGGEPFQEG